MEHISVPAVSSYEPVCRRVTASGLSNCLRMGVDRILKNISP
jgi:hypothetical protein